MKKCISLLLTFLMLFSIVTIGIVDVGAVNSVAVTVTSKQGLFADVSNTYDVGETFDITFMWQGDQLLRDGLIDTYFNNNSLKVLSYTKGDVLTGSVIHNITDNVQKNGMVTVNFSDFTGSDVSTKGTMFTYTVEVLETATEAETIEIDLFSASVVDPLNFINSIDYVFNGELVEEHVDEFEFSVTLSGMDEPGETDPSESSEPESSSSEDPEPSEPEPSEPESSESEPVEEKVYTIVGNINGQDVGCGDDSAAVINSYNFVDGTVTVNFAEDSYVYIKSTDNVDWYMFDGDCVEANGVLKNTSTGANGRMTVPAGTVKFTLIDNGDDTFTLSYIVFDETAPSVSFSTTDDIASSQTVTITMSDDKAVAGYYWGISNNYLENTFVETSDTIATEMIYSSGTYYVTVQDTSGNVSNTVSQTFYATILDTNGGDVDEGYIITPAGSGFELPIPTQEGYVFVGWSLSFDDEGEYVTFISPESDMRYYAIWEKEVISGDHTHSYDSDSDSTCNVCEYVRTVNDIIFKTAVGGVYKTIPAYTDVTTVASGNGPIITGFGFIGWTLTDDDIISAAIDETRNSAVIVEPLYESYEEYYTVSVYWLDFDEGEMGLIESQERQMGSVATFEAPEMEGYTFIGWSLDGEDVTLGTSTSYSMKIIENKRIYALYSAYSELVEEPKVFITDKGIASDHDLNQLFFTATRSVPDSFTLVEYGIIAVNDDANADIFNFEIGGTGVLQKKGDLTDEKNGAYTLFVDVGDNIDTTIYVRGYLIYETTNGERITIYSNIESGSFMELIG